MPPRPGGPGALNARFAAIEARVEAIESLMDPCRTAGEDVGIRSLLQQAQDCLQIEVKRARDCMNDVISLNGKAFKDQRDQERARIEKLENVGRAAGEKAALVERKLAETMEALGDLSNLESSISDMLEKQNERVDAAAAAMDAMAAQMEGTATAEEVLHLGRHIDAVRRRIEGGASAGEFTLAATQGDLCALRSRVDTLSKETRMLAHNLSVELTSPREGVCEVERQVLTAQKTAALLRTPSSERGPRSPSACSSRASSADRVGCEQLAASRLC